MLKKLIKQTPLAFIALALFLFQALPAHAEKITLRAGHLSLTLNSQGQVSQLTENRSKTKNYIHPTLPTYLIKIKSYHSKKFLIPTHCKKIKFAKGTTYFRLNYPQKITATIAITPKKNWFRIEMVAATNLKQIDTLSWGPINTSCQGSVGAFFGIVRSPDATLGMMSLEPNTDGLKVPYTEAAFWLPWKDGGSYLQLVSQDHTRKRSHGLMKTSIPVPGLTTIGSAVALYSTPKGRELDLIEKIVIAEKLPYPKYKGVWSKRSKKMLRPGIWRGFNAKNIDQYFDIASQFGGGEICGFHRMFGNWGHFDIDPKLYPGGKIQLRNAIKRGQKKGIGLTMYTLTNFTKSGTLAEPFISPIPHPGIKTYDVQTVVSEKFDAQTNSITIKKSKKLVQLLKSLSRRKKKGQPYILFWIDDEFILAQSIEFNQQKIVLKNCKRGYHRTLKKHHSSKAPVKICVEGTKHIYPGTLALSQQIAANIGRVTHDNGFTKTTFDGHESALHTGHGAYAMNQTAKIVYDANVGRELLVTGSRITNYTWHIISYISWGEFDLHKGFRGSMLDYRLRRQDQLSRALMPHKMGQHYPAIATAEDMNWLCGLAAGWDSGLELSLNVKKFNRNREKKEILRIVALWEKARISGALTPQQKMKLRQVDCIYHIKEKNNGTFKITLQKRWRQKGVKILPPSSVTLTRANRCTIESKSIDLNWLHCPLVATSAALSDDILLSSDQEASIKVFFPGPDASGRERQAFQCVLRIDANQKTGIRNPRFTVQAKTFVVPTDVKPGQYLAFTADLAIVHLYSPKHQLLRDIPIRHLNDLPGVPRGKTFSVKVYLPAIQKNTTAKARMNLYSFQPIPKPPREKK